MTSTFSFLDQEPLVGGFLPQWVYNEHQARWHFASGLVPGKVCVDCACGVGGGTAMFANSGALHVHAFDLSNDAVATARKRCEDLSNVTVLKGTSLPLAPNSIDVFISLETIEHIAEDKSFLVEVTRVLSDDGTFLCSTPNRSITMPGKELKNKPWNPFQIREYDQSEFLSLLTERFGSVRLLGQNPKPAWLVSMFEMIGKRTPGHTGGRINSAFKLPRPVFDREFHHRVQELQSNGTCEYLVAICSQPRKC